MAFVYGGVSSLENSAYFFKKKFIQQTLIEGHLCVRYWGSSSEYNEHYGVYREVNLYQQLIYEELGVIKHVHIVASREALCT